MRPENGAEARAGWRPVVRLCYQAITMDWRESWRDRLSVFARSPSRFSQTPVALRSARAKALA